MWGSTEVRFQNESKAQSSWRTALKVKWLWVLILRFELSLKMSKLHILDNHAFLVLLYIFNKNLMSEVCDFRKSGSLSNFSSTIACSLSYFSLVFLSLLIELPLKMRVYIYYLFSNSRLQCLRSLVNLRISYYFLAKAHFIF
jgi:hypothetical protein